MNDFDNLKSAWQAQPVPEFRNKRPVRSWLRPRKSRLEGQALWSGLVMGLLAAVLWGLQRADLLVLPTLYTRIALWSVCLTLVLQAGLNLANWLRLRRMDELLEPAAYLHQWKRYYQGRLQRLRWNGLVYFLSINLGFLVFLPQVLDTYPSRGYQIGFVCLYLLLMAFIWLNVGKHWLRAETKTLSGILDRLEQVRGQWQEDAP